MDKTPGPKPKKFVFGFLDETGLLHSTITDRLFGLGLIVVHHPSEIHRAIINYKNSKRFYNEFKFSEITDQNLDLYKGFIDLFFLSSEIRFHAVLYDKKELHTNTNYLTNCDKTYNKFTARLIAESIGASEYIVILADDVSTKKDNNYEKQIKASIKEKVRRNALFGICRLESHAVSTIQMTDVFLGIVAYAFKIKLGLVKPNKKSSNVKIIKYLQSKLNIPLLSDNFQRKMKRGVRFCVEECHVNKK